MSHLTTNTLAREYAGAFEVHITALASDEDALNRFQEWCRTRAYKCVWIVLARGEHAQQPMATWRRKATILSRVVAEAERRAAELNAAAIPVARVKVEAAPFNDGLPLWDADAVDHAPGNYFEHHAKSLRAAAAPREALVRVCELHGAHLSRNAFRDVEGGREERFVTLRCYDVGRITAEQRFRRLLAALAETGERVVESESEYCVYDSNLSLDAGWLPPQS